MAKMYSLDLRLKVFTAWQAGGSSQQEVAARFGVKASFVRDLSALHRQTGDVAARPRGGGRRSLASAAALAQLTGLVTVHHDHTMAEHHQQTHAAGHAMSAATVGRMRLHPQRAR